MACELAGRLAEWLAGWLDSWLAGWMVGWLKGGMGVWMGGGGGEGKKSEEAGGVQGGCKEMVYVLYV